MEHKVIATALLKGHSRNYRSHPPEQIKHLVASLTRFTQVRDIVVRKDKSSDRYTILAGHGVVEAARECFIPEMSCVVVPDAWTDEEANAYLVADNNINNGASDDDSVLAALLQEQQDAGFDLAALGSDDETLRQMLQVLGDEYIAGSGDTPDVEFKEFDETIADDLDTELCSECGKLCIKKGKA